MRLVKFFFITVIAILIIWGLGLLLYSLTSEESTEEAAGTALWQDIPNEMIVFVSMADSTHGELYLLDKDGRETRLTDNNRYETSPALSPDGSRIAFHAGDMANPLSWDIYVLDLHTGQETRLTENNVVDGHPDWSPDGSRIVFCTFSDPQGNPSENADLYVMNADGTGLSRLTGLEWEESDPAWSPDGSMITFKSTQHTQRKAREEIYVMNSDGTGIRRLTTTEGWQSDHDPSWSPDGSTIAYQRFEGGRPWLDMTDYDILKNEWGELFPWNVYAVDLEGNTTRLTDAEWSSGYPVFSADGSKIIFLKLDFLVNNNVLVGADHRLFLINKDGSEQVQLIPDDRHTPTMESYDL
jgi:Tol biopolymer transport system component